VRGVLCFGPHPGILYDLPDARSIAIGRVGEDCLHEQYPSLSR
jgi:hypothetical protein